MTVLTCDKCKKIIVPLEGFKWFTVHETTNSVNNKCKYDLCDSCYELFEKWLEEGKENEE